MRFTELQDEVKRRATRNEGGGTFDTAIKNAVNASLKRTAREAKWRPLRRKTTFDTVVDYTEGTGAGTFTESSTAVSVTGATFITDNIAIGRRVELEGSTRTFTIKTITSETDLTLDLEYDGDTRTDGEYEILPQEEYNLPIQSNHNCFLWHEGWGYKYQMQYLTDDEFYRVSGFNTIKSQPTTYRMWGEDMVVDKLLEPSLLTVSSTSASDTSIGITVHGTVSGYPDSEQITTNGTTEVAGSKSFSAVDRITKNGSTTGRINVTANSGNATVAVLPTGNTADGIRYRKAQLWPLPSTTIPINVQYYKDPYKMVDDDDVHELGEDFDEAIILLATSKIKGESEIKFGTTTFFSMWQDEVKSLRKTNVDKIDWFPTLKRPGNRRGQFGLVCPNLGYMQVGGNYGPSFRR